MAMEREGRCKAEEQVDDDLPLEMTGSRAAYERFSQEAAALSGPFSTPRANLGVAYHNVKAGVTAVFGEASRLREDIPNYDFARLRELPELVLATIYAASLVDRGAPKPTREIIARAAETRARLLSIAESLAKSGLLPSHEVARIRKGKGFIDIADDCTDLARLFTEYASAIRGKSPLTVSDVREASEHGTRLRTILRPKGSRKAPLDSELGRAIENRDRLWTLLVQRYELARRAGAWLFGVEKVNERVPALGSQVKAKTKAMAEKASSDG